MYKNFFDSLGLDETTKQHCEKVSFMAKGTGVVMKLPEAEILRLEKLALYHDIGKYLIPREILIKPGRLTEEEMSIMKLHTTLGERICNNYPFLNDCAQAARSHHEKLSGTGYPDRLNSGDIPLDVRIITTCDIYEALSSRRPYKDPLTHGECKRLLNEMVHNGDIDSNIVKCVLKFAELDLKNQIVQQYSHIPYIHKISPECACNMHDINLKFRKDHSVTEFKNLYKDLGNQVDLSAAPDKMLKEAFQTVKDIRDGLIQAKKTFELENKQTQALEKQSTQNIKDLGIER